MAIDEAPLPEADLQARMFRFWRWNGEPPAPQFTHWTSEGTIIIRIVQPIFASAVIWRGRDTNEAVLGNGSAHPDQVAYLIARGEYDKDAGFAISALVPADLSQWNNLGG